MKSGDHSQPAWSFFVKKLERGDDQYLAHQCARMITK
jgi:hypothetical protein